ncbi:hypothetical protein NQ314_013555 [Rhamnusium bicolor]|uniref:beta-mannosidase n=1 Tax=Rhamnusium bicolor TaxID=1586634 RepID=A0AAV8X609_9CUCU|nr:hypothetical protein NQ314_013555 [Rhamnusium bicolor]
MAVNFVLIDVEQKVYSLDFDDDLLNFENINIVFDGLDTFASVFVNDVKVGESQNMFVQYIFNIKTQLKPGVNRIEVNFQSPIAVAENYAGEQNKSYNIPPNCPPREYNGECHVNMIRKMQASFSWDWGPSFPSVGIWKDLYIESYNTSAIRYVVVDAVEKADAWALNIDTYFANNVRQYVVGSVVFQLALTSNLNISRIVQVSQPLNEYGEILLNTSFDVPKVYNGLTFYFKVNGVPIFMKGSNEIPIDILPEKGQDQTTIKQLLTDVHEVRHQVKRLRSHISLAIFSGNNENEGALADNWYGTQNNFEVFKKDYVTLYIDTVEKEFNRLTHNRGVFCASSPSNGKESTDEGYVAKYPGNPLYGDVHFYNYILDSFDSNIYPIPRFASEYGYQSLPSVDTLLTAANISELQINGTFIEHRQHHPFGNTELRLLIDYQLQLPRENSSNYYKILHAFSTKIQTEHYRRYRSSLDNQGRGYTMGALYWQLNDVWVAPTWASIDYTGKWKMLQYYTVDFFAPIIITGHINALRTLEIYVVSDLLSPVLNVTAFIQVYKWDSLEAISVSNLTLDLEAGKSHLIDSFNIDDYLVEQNCGLLQDAKYNCFIYLSLDKDGLKIAPDNFVLPGKLKKF